MPLLQEANGAERWYVARRWEAPDRSFSLQVFVWPPGTRIMIDDHSSLGAYSCAAGTVFEVRYERLDDGPGSSTPASKRPGIFPGTPRTGPRRCCPEMEVSTGSGTHMRRRQSRCTCTGREQAGWTDVTTTPRGTTSATGWTTRRMSWER